MAEREYIVTVGQDHYREHVIVASSLKEARAKIAAMILDRDYEGDPVEPLYSRATDVGSEHIVAVERAPWDRPNRPNRTPKEDS